jgi:excisionase family DNA binding protein
MKNKRLLSPKEAAYELGISVKTVHRWDEAGTLRTVRTTGNQRRIPIEEITRLRRQGEGKQGGERCVLYARVSSGRQEQDGNLARQTERHRGMQRLLALIGEQALEVVLIEYPDRLVCFGFSYLEEAFSWMGVRLELLDAPKQLEPSEELVQDLLTIVTVFAGRLYGQRANGIRKRVQTALQEYETGEGLHRTTYGTGEQDHQTTS